MTHNEKIPENWLKRIFRAILIIVASIAMWIEESLWEWLKVLTGWISLIPVIRRIEAMILKLPPYPAMIVFLLPMITLFPLKLIAVYWFAHGHWLAALVLVVTAKVLGTAIVARMYVVCYPKLMTIEWVRRLHDCVITIRDRLYAAVRSLPFYVAAREFVARIKFAARNVLIQFRKLFR